MCIDSLLGDDEIHEAVDIIHGLDDDTWKAFAEDTATPPSPVEEECEPAEGFFVNCNSASTTISPARDNLALAYRFMADGAVSHSLLCTLPNQHKQSTTKFFFLRTLLFLYLKDFALTIVLTQALLGYLHLNDTVHTRKLIRELNPVILASALEELFTLPWKSTC